jgi:hypothetical protein
MYEIVLILNYFIKRDRIRMMQLRLRQAEKNSVTGSLEKKGEEGGIFY